MTGITANLANMISQSIIGRLSAGNGGAESIPISTLASFVLAKLQDTSTSSITVGTGAQTFIVSPGKAFTVGQPIYFTSTANPSNYLYGNVTSYNVTTGQLVASITAVGGSGTYSSWNVGVSGPQGGTGPAGPASTFPNCGQLVYTSATQLTFNPKNGSTVQIGGALYSIGSGITITNTGVEVGGVAGQSLANSTAYDLFLKNNGSGTPIPSFYATGGASGGHIPDTTAGNVGIEVRSASGSPDTTRTYIGKIQTNTIGQFADAAQTRWVLSWFNQRQRTAITTQTSANSTSSALAAVAGTNISILSFGTDDVLIDGGGTAANSGSGNADNIQAYVDGAGAGLPCTSQPYTNNGQSSSNFPPYAAVLTEGVHTINMALSTSGGTFTITNASVRAVFRG